MFYEVKKKHVIGVGSSDPSLNHSVLLAKHAEEFALKDINRYISKTSEKNLKNIRVIIWKENRFGIIRETDCCAWCKKSILRSKLDRSQIITPEIDSDGYWKGTFKCSINEKSKIPLKRQ